jgi:hypothetical protein
MKPITFPESNKTLLRPASMTEDECASLPVWTDGHECISRWEPTWKERLMILFGCPVWLRIMSGHTQPPVSLSPESPFERQQTGGPAHVG